MTFTFRPAKDKNEPRRLLLGFAGKSGCGKTASALRLATGMAAVQGGRIRGIDTENGRMLEYRDYFDFDHATFDPPFNPARYAEAIRAADGDDVAAIIVDSASHEHDGPGGVLEMHEDALQRMAGDDRQKRERMNMRAWITPKRERTHLLQGTLIRTRAHVIVCFRAKDKIKMARKDGKSVPVEAGCLPICGGEWEYEFTARGVMDPERPGVIDWSAPWSRINGLDDRLLRCFPQDGQITEDTGRALAEWAAGGAAKPAEPGQAHPGTGGTPAQTPTAPDGRKIGDDEYAELLKASWAEAYKGTAALQAWWKGLPARDQRALRDWKDNLKTKAAEVDEAQPKKAEGSLV